MLQLLAQQRQPAAICKQHNAPHAAPSPSASQALVTALLWRNQSTLVDLSKQPSCTPCSLLYHAGHACSLIPAVGHHVSYALHRACWTLVQAVIGVDLMPGNLHLGDGATSLAVDLRSNAVSAACMVAPAAHKRFFLQRN